MLRRNVEHVQHAHRTVVYVRSAHSPLSSSDIGLSSINGGYVDQSGAALIDGGGSLFLGSHDGITGPGGADLMLDNDGVIVVYRTLSLNTESQGETDHSLTQIITRTKAAS